MKRNTFISLIILTFLPIFTASMVFVSQSFADHRGFHGPRPDVNLPDWLDLTPEQADKIRMFRIAFEESVISLESTIQQKHAELRLLWLQLKPDAEKIKNVEKIIHDTQYQILEKMIDLKINIRGVLTEKQVIRNLAVDCPDLPGPCFDQPPFPLELAAPIRHLQ
jgi:Spy/CpxP family protein refolding chaperone